MRARRWWWNAKDKGHSSLSPALLDPLPRPSPAICTPLPLPFNVCTFIVCVQPLSPFLACRALAPSMVLPSTGPPGLKKPKPLSPSPPPSHPPAHIFSPAPSKPSSSWFNLLASPSPSPIPLLPSAVTAVSQVAPQSLTPLPISQQFAVAVPYTGRLVSAFKDNSEVIKDISVTLATVTDPNTNDPWTHAHLRVCAHASERCAACSIALMCCSCRALCFTPGPPPASPAPVTTHGLPHYEYLIRRTGMFTFTFLLIALWLTHTDLPIPLTLCPILVITLYPSYHMRSTLCPVTILAMPFALAHHVYNLMYL